MTVKITVEDLAKIVDEYHCWIFGDRKRKLLMNMAWWWRSLKENRRRRSDEDRWWRLTQDRWFACEDLSSINGLALVNINGDEYRLRSLMKLLEIGEWDGEGFRWRHLALVVDEDFWKVARRKSFKVAMFQIGPLVTNAWVNWWWWLPITYGAAERCWRTVPKNVGKQCRNSWWRTFVKSVDEELC